MADIFTPESIVAGSIPIGSKNPLEAAYHAASYGLDADSVHIVSSVSDGRIYYLAAPSVDFASHMSAETILSVALPGMPGHHGDAAYVASIGVMSCVVVKLGQSLYSYVGDESGVQTFASSYDVPVIYVDDSVTAPWAGFNQTMLERAKRMSAMLHIGGASLAGILFLAWGGLGVLGGSALGKKEAAESTITVNADDIKRNILSSQPMLTTLSDIQRVASVAMSAGGWVNFYKVEKGAVSWEVEMPMWITGDYLSKLASDAKAVRQDGKSTILVQKNVKN